MNSSDWLTDAVLEQISLLARIGISELTIAARLSVSFQDWEKAVAEHPEIKNALQSGLHLGISDVASALFDEATDPKGSFAAKKFFLQAKDPENWKEAKNSNEVSMRVGKITGHDVSYVDEVLSKLKMEENEK